MDEKRILSTNRESIDGSFFVTDLGNIHKPFSRNIVWYGFGKNWCQWAYPRGMLKPKIFEIEVDESKILKLDTLKDAIRFADEFANPNDKFRIDWQRVAQRWDGIEISEACIDNYLSSNADLPWLEGWDIGSGCIWKGSAITASKRLPELEQQYGIYRGHTS